MLVLALVLAAAALRMGVHTQSREHSREAFTLARDAGDAAVAAEAAAPRDHTPAFCGNNALHEDRRGGAHLLVGQGDP